MTLSEVTDLLTALASLATVAALVFAAHSLRQARMLNREAVSKQIYTTALKGFIEYPELAEPEDYRKLEGAEKVRYKWLVGSMLNALEELIYYSVMDHQSHVWTSEIRRIVDLHADYLSSPDFWEKERSSYNRNILTIIDRRLAEIGHSNPPSQVSLGE